MGFPAFQIWLGVAFGHRELGAAYSPSSALRYSASLE